MLIEIKVPQISESVAEATLLAWRKKEGQTVKRDENLIDIETDKVVLELPAPVDGVITSILKQDGATVKAGEIIAILDTEAKASVAPLPFTEVPAMTSPAPGAAVMPAARKIAAERDLDTTTIAGSGKGGRVTKSDVLANAMAEPRNAAPAAVALPGIASVPSIAQLALPPVAPITEQLLGGRPEQRVPMSRLRARVAERLVQSQSTAAILTTFNEVNMAPVIELRNRYKERFEKEHGAKLGFMSFFLKAAVHALKKYPVLNASVDGNDIVYHGYFDIGIAVGSPRGLVVPIVRDADQLSLAEIEKKITDLGKRAQDGKLAIEELTGGTFSITNGGVFGSMLSTPILNPPQSAILGVHATKDRPVAEGGQVVIRPMNYLALSYDHRIIDGREAVLGLVAMKDVLEDPARLLLDV